MKTSIRFLMCGLAAVSLSSCQSLWSDLGFGPKKSNDEAAMASDTLRIDRGRQALRMQSPGTAIHHFERAALDAEHAPEAFNGMGVAYAMLGREDLAERFFNAALMLRPQDERYTRNLARLYNSDIGNSRRARAKVQTDTLQALADAKAAAIGDGLLPAAVKDTGRRGAITIGQPRRASVRRTSSGEILIRSAQSTQSAASSIEVASRRKAEPAPPAKNDAAIVEDAEAAPPKTASAQPKTVRFALDRSASAISAKPLKAGQAGNPVKIQIGAD
ncbi:hypothetical protein [Erythrobacter sp. MTPC3]|uniref:hypothetical protein n=1 Tax=Erythrobacter sp. MTPC3 TaxID=3056564 RepID=UPI0036F1CE94